MSMVALGLCWYALLVVGGAGGALVLSRWGMGAGVAWAVGRPLAWVAAGYAGWLFGCVGLRHWWWVGAPVLVALAVACRAQARRVLTAHLVAPELIGVLAFVTLAVLRLPALDVTATEKPMDLAILATLLRPGSLPPGDPWLAGLSLPYYHFGFVPWVLPAHVLGLAPDVAFNLLVPTIAAVTAQLGWALARALGCGRRGALAAAFLVVFAGTPDGWLQLAAGTPLAGIDLWRSSRAIAGAITEFPLFTFWLGDLHPHLLSVPLLLLAIVLARTLGRPAGEPRVPWPVVALAYGAAAAANPWCALPAGLAVLLAAVAAEERFHWPRGEGLGVWIHTVAVGALGWALFWPFWMAYRSPVAGIGGVTTPTRLDELGLFLGAMLVAPAFVALELVSRLGGFDARRRQLTRALLVLAAVVLTVATRRPALVLALAIASVLASVVMRGRSRRARPAWALTIVALLLLAVMEAVYVRDPYVGELYRMNTVFKTTHVAFTLLAVCGPALVEWLHRRRPLAAAIVTALVIASGLPHLAALVGRVAAPHGHGWDGLAWMAPGESEAAHWLYRRPGRPVLVEAVGEAYSDAARLASASGVPAVLGWENHETVWRGAAVGPELQRRRRLVEELYRAQAPEEVRRLAVDLGATHVAIGSVERRLYPDADFAAVRNAGVVELAAAGCEIVRIGE